MFQNSMMKLPLFIFCSSIFVKSVFLGKFTVEPYTEPKPTGKQYITINGMVYRQDQTSMLPEFFTQKWQLATPHEIRELCNFQTISQLQSLNYLTSENGDLWLTSSRDYNNICGSIPNIIYFIQNANNVNFYINSNQGETTTKTTVTTTGKPKSSKNAEANNLNKPTSRKTTTRRITTNKKIKKTASKNATTTRSPNLSKTSAKLLTTKKKTSVTKDGSLITGQTLDGYMLPFLQTTVTCTTTEKPTFKTTTTATTTTPTSRTPTTNTTPTTTVKNITITTVNKKVSATTTTQTTKATTTKNTKTRKPKAYQNKIRPIMKITPERIDLEGMRREMMTSGGDY